MSGTDTPAAGTPATPRHEIWWQVFPLGFLAAEPGALPEGSQPVPRLPRLEAWLDHLLELGANGLLLGPVFAAETHGYDTVDHLRVDPRLGTDDDLLHLVTACHDRGIRVALDGVFHHVARSHPAFADVLAHGRDARHAGWFRIRWDATAPEGFGSDGFDYDDFEGHHHLVALDHGNPEVVDHVVDVLIHWIDRGVDGWRLDAAYAVPTSFWREVTDRVRERYPHAWFLGELIHGDHAAFVRESGIDTVTQYELWKAVWSSLNDGNLWELSHALGRHDALLDTFQPQTFVGNHDVTRIASRLVDDRLLPHALVVLFTVAGEPSIYAGDEHGFRGVKEERVGGDDAVRPAFPATPDELSDAGRPIFDLHRELIAVRRRHPWLATARLTVHEVADTRIGYEVASGDDVLFVALNLDDATAHVPLPATFTRSATAADGGRGDGGIVAGAGQRDAEGVRVPGRGWAVLVP